MTINIEDVVKLYAFYPSGHGPLSFFICCYSKDVAVSKINDYIEAEFKDGNLSGYDFDGFPDDYTCEEYKVNRVAINDNG